MSAEWALDHIFVTVDGGGRDAALLRQFGLEPSYSRSHPGQGSANLCFCLDNAYLELVWQTDADEAEGCALSRCHWSDRLAAHTGNGVTSPFGIAIRPADVDSEPDMPFRSWRYRPSYLPQAVSIRVATASDEPRLPFLFSSPGNAGPADWADGRGGNLQRKMGLTRIEAVILRVPGARDGTLARALDSLTWLGVFWGADAHAMELILSDDQGGLRRLRLPVQPPPD